MSRRLAVAVVCMLASAIVAPKFSVQSSTSAPGDGCAQWASGQLGTTGSACGSAGGTAVAGDIGDDGNDSNALNEIAIVNDNLTLCSIGANKLLCDLNYLTPLGYATGTGGVLLDSKPVLAGVNDDDCTGEQGAYWYDSTDGAFEWCPTNSGTPSLLGSGGSDLTGLSDVTLTTPATGAVLVKSAGDWIDGQVDLADGDAVTGTLAVGNGGTGATTLTGILLGNGTSAVTALASSGTGDVARVTSPSFTTPSLGAATASTASSGDNDTSVATTAFVNTEIAADVPLITTGTADASGTCTAGTWYFETDAETLCFCHTTNTQACITMSEAP